MRRSSVLYTAALACLLVLIPSPSPVHATGVVIPDPIITSVDAGGTITVIRRFPDGSRIQLAQTDSLADAQKAWLDGVSKILQGK